MKFFPLAMATALFALVFFPPSQREGEGGGLTQHAQTHHLTQNERPSTILPASLSSRFLAIDIFIDSPSPLAAYQLDFTASMPGQDDHSGTTTKIVGVEGGEPACFRDAPYYDPRAMQGERVILGALSTLPTDQLPRGKVRVARVHIMAPAGTTDPNCTLTLTTAANADAEKINASASWAVTTSTTDDHTTTERK